MEPHPFPRLLGRMTDQGGAGFKGPDEPLWQASPWKRPRWEETPGQTKRATWFFIPATHLPEQNLPALPSHASRHREASVLSDGGGQWAWDYSFSAGLSSLDTQPAVHLDLALSSKGWHLRSPFISCPDSACRGRFSGIPCSPLCAQRKPSSKGVPWTRKSDSGHLQCLQRRPTDSGFRPSVRAVEAAAGGSESLLRSPGVTARPGTAPGGQGGALCPYLAVWRTQTRIQHTPGAGCSWPSFLNVCLPV